MLQDLLFFKHIFVRFIGLFDVLGKLLHYFEHEVTFLAEFLDGILVKSLLLQQLEEPIRFKVVSRLYYEAPMHEDELLQV